MALGLPGKFMTNVLPVAADARTHVSRSCQSSIHLQDSDHKILRRLPRSLLLTRISKGLSQNSSYSTRLQSVRKRIEKLKASGLSEERLRHAALANTQMQDEQQ